MSTVVRCFVSPIMCRSRAYIRWVVRLMTNSQRYIERMANIASVPRTARSENYGNAFLLSLNLPFSSQNSFHNRQNFATRSGHRFDTCITRESLIIWAMLGDVYTGDAMSKKVGWTTGGFKWGWVSTTLAMKYRESHVFGKREITFTFAICYRRFVCLSVVCRL